MSRLQQLRESRRISQAELAKQAKVTQQAVAKWEAGESFPRADKLPQLARILGCTINDLFEADEKAASSC